MVSGETQSMSHEANSLWHKTRQTQGRGPKAEPACTLIWNQRLSIKYKDHEGNPKVTIANGSLVKRDFWQSLVINGVEENALTKSAAISIPVNERPVCLALLRYQLTVRQSLRCLTASRKASACSLMGLWFGGSV